MKTAWEWIGHVEGWGRMTCDEMRAGEYLDDHGWFLRMPEGNRAVETLLMVDLPPSATSFNGRFRVTYEGEGRISMRGGSNVRFGKGEIRFDRSAQDAIIGIQILETDPKGAGNYIRKFAECARDTLDPRLNAQVEYSSEIWNFLFGQKHWVLEKAEARWKRTGGPEWMEHAGMRAAEMAQILDGVFGSEAEHRLVKVIGLQTGWPGLEEPLLNAPSWVAEDPGKNLPPYRYFEAYAVTGYCGGLGEDTLILGDGDDLIVTLGGSDHVHGGSGCDTAQLAGQAEDDAFERQDDGLLLAIKGTMIVHLRKVEKPVFEGQPGGCSADRGSADTMIMACKARRKWQQIFAEIRRKDRLWSEHIERVM